MKNYHFIGMCGKAMGTLAAMLQQQGHTITGSDSGFYEPMLSYLKDHQVNFIEGYKASNIPDDVDFIVIGKHAALVPEENEEVARAFSEFPDKIRSFPQIINELTKNTNNLICAGSFGKSTITTLASFVLEHAGKNPSYFIGAVPIDLEDSGKLQSTIKTLDAFPSLSQRGWQASEASLTGDIFVLEGDEYPSANFDFSAKFLHYNPTNVLITSCEHDHINVYPTVESFIKPFVELVKIIPENGILVYAKEGSHIEDSVLPFSKTNNIFSYGVNCGADYDAKNIQYSEITAFDIYASTSSATGISEIAPKDDSEKDAPEGVSTKLVSIKTKLIGKHNIENITGVACLLFETGLVTPEEFANAISEFHGVKGRLDRKISDSAIPLFESYGSSYAKARSDLDALKLHFGEKKIIDIFEPHTFGWRNRGNLSWYQTAFKGVSCLYIFHPPHHGAGTHDQITREEMVSEIQNSCPEITVRGVENRNEVYEFLKQDLTVDSLVVMTTSGALDCLPEELPKIITTLIEL